MIVDFTEQEQGHRPPHRQPVAGGGARADRPTGQARGHPAQATYGHEGRTLRRRAGGYARAKLFERLRAVLKRQRTILGRLLREVRRKMGGLADETRAKLYIWVQRAELIQRQRPKDKNKLYALHAPEA